MASVALLAPNCLAITASTVPKAADQVHSQNQSRRTAMDIQLPLLIKRAVQPPQPTGQTSGKSAWYRDLLPRNRNSSLFSSSQLYFKSKISPKSWGYHGRSSVNYRSRGHRRFSLHGSFREPTDTTAITSSKSFPALAYPHAISPQRYRAKTPRAGQNFPQSKGCFHFIKSTV